MTTEIRAIIFGVAFWFVAAMVVHLLPALFDGGLKQALLFAVSIPFCWVSVRVAAFVIGVTVQEVLIPAVIGTIVATFLDGVAMTWFSGLYHGISAETQFGAAWILYGVGWILLFALLVRKLA